MTSVSFSITEPFGTQTEQTMKTRRISLTTVVLSLAGGVLGGLLLAAPPAYAQSAVTSATPTASGTVGSTPPPTHRFGVPAPQDPPASVSVACSDPVKLTPAAV